MPTSDQLPSLRGVKKILVVRLGAMGDAIHAMPAVAALRQAFPNAKIGWVIEERWVELLCSPAVELTGAISPHRPLVDFVHTVNTFRWRENLLSSQTRREIKELKRVLHAEQYEVAIDFQGALKSAVIARWSKAEQIYGFAEPREKIARRSYSQRIRATGKHVIEQNLSLADAVAQKRIDMASAELPHDPIAENKMQNWLREQGVSRFAILNPGAGWGAKQWPAERYGYVAKQLSISGVRCLINFGPKEEELAKRVELESYRAAQAIQCSITELIALTRRAALFIGGDTGPMHLAAALDVPVVAIFGPTDPTRNGPFGVRNVVLRNAASATSYSHKKEADDGLMQISVEEVLSEAKQLLGDNA